MATQKAISANVEKNNGATVLYGGTVVGDAINSVDYGDTNMDVIGQPDTAVTAKAISGGDFNNDNRLVSMLVTETIAGTAVNILAGGAGIQSRRHINSFTGYAKKDLSSYNELTGLATYGANAGDRVVASGINGDTGRTADDAVDITYAVPSEFTYRKGSPTPVQDEYDAWTG